MGFFDGLDTVGKYFSERFGSFANAFTDSLNNMYGGATQAAAGVWDLVTAASDDKTLKGGLGEFFGGAGRLGHGTLGLVGSPFQLPGLHETATAADKVYRYGVDRPIGAMFGAIQDAGSSAQREGSGVGGYIDRIASADTWRRAWNDSRYVTAGQSITYAAGDLWHRTLDDDPLGWGDRHDPTDTDNRKMWKDNPWYKITSGSIDAALNIFGDPTSGAIPAGKAVKLKMMPRLNTARDLEKYQSAGKVSALYDFAAEARNSEHVRQVVFNSHSFGSQLATIFHDVAKNGDRELFNDFFLAAAGDPGAWADLTGRNKRLAEFVGRRKAGPSIAHDAARQGMTKEATERVIAIGQTTLEAYLEAVAETPFRGALRGQVLPTVSRWGRLRTGLHYGMLYGTPVAVSDTLLRGNLATRAMPTQGYTRFIDAYDFSRGVALFRSNMERSILSAAEVDKWTQKYGMAATNEARHVVAMEAESAALAAEARRVGMKTPDIEKALPIINKWRAGHRTILSNSRKYMPEEARKLADRYNERGFHAKAKSLNRLADAMEADPDGLLVPKTVLSLVDQDGNPAFVPYSLPSMVPVESPRVTDASRPVTEPQLGDFIPMTDYRALRGALRWYKWGYTYEPAGWDAVRAGAARTFTGTRDITLTTADMIMAAWKASATMRPATALRSVTDELARRVAMYGQMPFLVGAGQGIINAGKTMTRRGALRSELWREKRLARLANGSDVIDVEASVSDVADNIPMSKEELKSVKEGSASYGSYSDAFAHGAISLNDYLRAVRHHGEAIGDLPETEAILWQLFREARDNGDKAGQRMAIREIAKEALHRAGRDHFTRPEWQERVVNYIDRRPLLFDPTNSVANPIKRPEAGPASEPNAVTKDYRLWRTETFKVDANAPERAHDALYDYIIGNLDELLKPDTLLYARPREGGGIALSIAKANKDRRAAEPVKLGARARINGFRADGMADAGRTGFRIKTPDGGTIYIKAAFEGPDGQRARVRLQSRGADDNYITRKAETELERIAVASGGWEDITPDNPRYTEAWTRVVNRQLANDEVARKYLAGVSLENCYNWVEKNAEGRAYARRMGYEQENPYRRVAAVAALVDTLVPGHGEHGSRLREAVLQGRANVGMLRKASAPGDLPAVHAPTIAYNLGQGAIAQRLNKVTDVIYKYLQDLPSDKASRVPFYAEAYKRHVDNIFQATTTIHAARNVTIPFSELERIEKQARQMALDDVRRYLYDTSTRVDLANATRFIVPFSSAIHDAFTKWGRIATESPGAPLLLWKYWTTFEANNMVEDENGNVLSGGVWYSRDPLTGEETRLAKGAEGKDRYVLIRLPSFMSHGVAKSLYGADGESKIRINKNTLNVFLGLPTAGPVVAVPASNFALSHPEFGESKLIRQFVLPFGPSSGSMWRQMVPSSTRAAWDMFQADEDEGALATGQAMAILQTEMVAHARGERHRPPTYEEAREKAASLRMVRFFSVFASPASFQVQSPYQPYINAYKALRASHPQDADELFYQKYGEEFWALTASVTRNAGGVPATVEGVAAYRKYQKLIQENPELASLIIGAEGAGEFAKAAYEWQKTQALTPGSDKKLRMVYSLEDSVGDAQRRLTWAKYSKMMGLIDDELAQRGLSNVNRKGAEDLLAYKRGFIKKFSTWTDPGTGQVGVSPWYRDYMESDSGAMQRRLDSMRRIVQDPALRGRDDMGGLVEYLALRKEVKADMAELGVKRLDNRKAGALKSSWDSKVKAMRLENPAFADLWARWLERDELLEAN